ncbi:MAG: hypothetical protein HY315_06445 [Acidobacteria bacterium]|nr:hypothetical protein [Acidobacteriota bacterium]
MSRGRCSVLRRGVDYEVTVPVDEAFEDATTVFEIGPYLLEVKATTTGAARLTPTQAQTAAVEPSRYVLCVVDLRGIRAEELDAQWTAARVEPLAKLISNVGNKVHTTCLLVEAAKASSVGIRNESALRYELPPTVWETGASISEWVAAVAESLARVTEQVDPDAG